MSLKEILCALVLVLVSFSAEAHGDMNVLYEGLALILETVVLIFFTIFSSRLSGIRVVGALAILGSLTLTWTCLGMLATPVPVWLVVLLLIVPIFSTALILYRAKKGRA
jgi:hypothetical protein